jgi:two-component system alkaline phosphatase synthesis response regulator PhoP
VAKTILVADDEVHIVRIIEDKLIRDGHRVITAADGQEALEKALAERPDLILMDVMMPRMNGFEVCRRLRQEEATRTTPIFLITAQGQESDEEAGREAGANRYITKPFSPRQLSQIVREALAEGDG